MGILNVTPDSFSDGGSFLAPQAALSHVAEMIDAGATFIDVGGESTRPGAKAVSLQEELDRVVPVIEAISARFDVVISVDTSKAPVMREAVNAGAALINDVYALRGDDALATACVLDVPVCLMHMQGAPRTMQANPVYTDVVAEVAEFLAQRTAACVAAGIPRDRIILDPGFGFGKTLAHNLSLFRALPRLVAQGLPVLVGVSRKSMIGTILDKPVDQRLYGSIALAGLAAWSGAAIIRTHDVAATMDAVNVCLAVREST